MGGIGKARALASELKHVTPDAGWMLPLAVYRLSGRRLARSPKLYRAGVPRQLRTHLPGMTTLTERAYFKWHAQERFVGHGEAVDLGSWFGSTAATLAMGLRVNPRPTARHAKVHAYDRFVWEPWMDDYAEVAKLGPYSPGDSFLREFELVTEPWRDRIEVHSGDLMAETWRESGIELLLVDAMKSWELTRHILTHFFIALTPGEAYVLHQDFGHCYTPWIHLVTYMLRDYLVPDEDVARSDTMVFRAVRSFDDAVPDLAVTRASFDDADVEQAFQHSLQITRPEKHSGVRAARAMLLVYDGDLAGARDMLRLLESNDKLSKFDASAVLGAIEEAEASSAEP